MNKQSTRYIMMMEPAAFYANPETMETNTYQSENPEDVTAIHQAAVQEFRNLRDALVEKGVLVTTARGLEHCPDDIFCNNWISTHEGGDMVLYPMLAENRRTERRQSLLDILKGRYDLALDLSEQETQGKFLESTGSLCLDRVNKIAYSAKSPRTNEDLARQWIREMGYNDIILFDTRNHVGKPVYHTDVLMYIGSDVAGICDDCIVEEDRARVMEHLSAGRDVVSITMDQMRSFCGNALEVRGTGGRKLLAMSATAHDALRNDQKEKLLRHVDEIVSAPIPTIEKYGGGSVRCMLLEMF